MHLVAAFELKSLCTLYILVQFCTFFALIYYCAKLFFGFDIYMIFTAYVVLENFNFDCKVFTKKRTSIRFCEQKCTKKFLLTKARLYTKRYAV